MKKAGAGFIEKGLLKIREVLKDGLGADEKIFSYFKVFMDDKGVAAVTPSSRYLVKRVIKAMDIGKNQRIIEYGAAEGVMTRRILDHLGPGGRLLSIELNDRFFEALKELSGDPRLDLFHGDVRKIDSIAKARGLRAGELDAIVSGVPFAFLSEEGRHELLSKTAALLRPGGRFVAYQITTHLIPLLKKYFRPVRMDFEIRNIPPHFVFTAFK